MSQAASNVRELMAGQLAIWNALQLEPTDPIYNIGEYLDIQGDLNIDLFVAALRRMLAEADSLNVSFRGTGTELRHYAMPPDRIPIHVIDLSSSEDPVAVAVDWMWRDLYRPLDLENGPLATDASRVADTGPVQQLRCLARFWARTLLTDPRGRSRRPTSSAGAW